MINKKIILFTSGFPYGKTEAFLETEIIYLAKSFKHVEVVAVNPDSKIIRELPNNCTTKTIIHTETIINKITSLKYLFNPLFWNEIKIIKTIYKKKLTIGIIKTMLMGLFRAKNIKKFVTKNYNINSNKHIFYSYWCDDTALGLALIKLEFPFSKFISRIHGWDVYFEQSKFNYLAFRHYIAENLDAIYSISNYGKEYCTKKWLLSSSNKLYVSKLGINQQKKLKPISNVIISCSNVIKLKRIDLIIRALSELKYKNLKWVHFGDGTEMKVIKKMAHDKLTGLIEFELKGIKNNSHLMQWYKETKPSLFINLSSSEGVPVSIMEAMSFGVPVIATNVGGTSEIVDNENGFLLAENPLIKDISGAIESYFTLNLELKILKQNAAYNTWHTKFNAKKNYKNFCDLITQL